MSGPKRTIENYFQENGIHKWHRVSSTEKRNRVHTSGVIVIVYEEDRHKEFELNSNDVKRKYTRGSGKGGQHRNKVETAVQLKHIPTGIQVFAQRERSQSRNEEVAWNLLYKKVKKHYEKGNIHNRDLADDTITHIRTYKETQDRAVDHRGNQMSLKHFKRGKIERIW